VWRWGGGCAGGGGGGGGGKRETARDSQGWIKREEMGWAARRNSAES
jgi:hypothetical protein